MGIRIYWQGCTTRKGRSVFFWQGCRCCGAAMLPCRARIIAAILHHAAAYLNTGHLETEVASSAAAERGGTGILERKPAQSTQMRFQMGTGFQHPCKSHAFHVAGLGCNVI